MPDININAKVPEVARDRVKNALGYQAKVEEVDEEGNVTEVDNPKSEEQHIADELKRIVNRDINKRLKRQAQRTAEYTEVNLDITLEK